MISKPEYGWTQIQIGNFSDRASYLTDIPVQCLKAFIFALENNLPASINFDAEGWEYIVVSGHDETHIITGGTDTEFTHLACYGISKKMLAKELIEDIEKYLEDWTEWTEYGFNGATGKTQRVNVLHALLTKLKKLV